MKDWIKKLLQILLCFALALAAVIYIDRKAVQKPPTIVVKTITDTLIIHDTIRKVEPKYIVKRVVDSIPVPVPVPGGKDTIWMNLPKEQKVYADSTYRAVVSGYLPSLDTIDVFRKTVYIDKETIKTVYAQPSRWSLGVQAGYGVSKSGLSPYIGIGVQYNLWNPRMRGQD